MTPSKPERPLPRGHRKSYGVLQAVEGEANRSDGAQNAIGEVLVDHLPSLPRPATWGRSRRIGSDLNVRFCREATMITSVNVKCFVAVIALSGVFVAATAVSASGADPRKCASTGGHINSGPVVDGPTFCAGTAAQLAFRRYMTAVTHSPVIYSAPMDCRPGASNLVWTCTFAAGKGTVTFRALANGWHTRVVVACTTPAARAATFCR